ncbi:ABC-type dipeptide/oligopeptide/nickel transport system permease component [Constrictibacter sp. MBR-5]
MLAGDTASLQQIEEIRTRLGLNEPLYKQFAIWMGQLATGDLDESFFFKMPGKAG